MKKRYLIPIMLGLMVLSGCGNNPLSADSTNNSNRDISSDGAESYELIIEEADEGLSVESGDNSALPIITESNIETTIDYAYPVTQTETAVITEEVNSTESTLTATEENNIKPHETKKSKPVTIKEEPGTQNDEIIYEYTEDNADASLPLIIENCEPSVTSPDTAWTSIEIVTTVSTSRTYYIPIEISETTDHGGSETTNANNEYINTEVIELPIIRD